MRNWVFKGDGNWCGWSYPWAATIWARLNNPEAAVMNLRFFHENYVNEGRGTAFRAMFRGSTLISDVVWAREKEEKNREIMQLDAGFDAMNAVFELLVQNRDDLITVLPVIHKDWKELSFEGILAEGAFLVSAFVQEGKTKKIVLKSKKGEMLKLKHGFEGKYKVDGEKMLNEAIFQTDTSPGQEIILEDIDG